MPEVEEDEVVETDGVGEVREEGEEDAGGVAGERGNFLEGEERGDRGWGLGGGDGEVPWC